MDQENNKILTVGERNLYIVGDIDCNNMAETNAKLHAIFMNSSNSASTFRGYDIGHINLHIQSCGGSIGDMWALIDNMLLSPIPIYTYVQGHAESAACLIFLAGSRRFIYKHGEIMYHQLSCGKNLATMQEIQDWTSYLEREQNKMEEFVKERTFMKAKQLKELRTKKIDFYMDANEALALGFATNVFDITDWGNIFNA